MKSFEILRKLRRGYTQENWVVDILPIKISGKDLFLHTLYINGSPLKKTIYEKYEDYELGEYGVFVNKYNGVKLFSGSFVVFGYNFTANSPKSTPSDIGVENGILSIKDGVERLYIASLGDYLFSLKKGSQTIYCTKRGSDEDIFEWQAFDMFFMYMYKSLLKLYDAKGYKLTPQKSKFPSIVNRTTDINEIFTAHIEVEEEEKALGIFEEPQQSEQDIEEDTEEDMEEEFDEDLEQTSYGDQSIDDQDKFEEEDEEDEFEDDEDEDD